MPGTGPAGGEFQPTQDGDLHHHRRRKKRVMSLIAEGFPDRESRLFELLERLQEPVTNLSGVTDAIAAEPSLQEHLLTFCEHSHPWRSAGALPLAEAVVLLGREQLRVLLLGWAFTRFAAGRLPNGLMASFERHSLRTAVRGQEIARRVRPEAAAQAYLGGLLHDIGRLPLLLAAQETILAEETVSPQPDDRAAAERAFFGVDHCQAGRWMALAGNFPGWLTEVIEHHHEPAQAAENRTLVALVGAADRMAQPTASGGRRLAESGASTLPVGASIRAPLSASIPSPARAAVRVPVISLVLRPLVRPVAGPKRAQAGAPVLVSLLSRRPSRLGQADAAARSRFLQAAQRWSGRLLFGSC